MEKRKIIAIIGPNASGKTGWGVSVARKFNGEIVSADSRQVYRGLDIGTGKDLSEYGDIKYHLIDICDPKPQQAGFRASPGEKFTVFDWLEHAKKVIKDIFSRGKIPVVVGGTGLYLQALIEGFELGKFKISNFKFKKYSRAELEKKSLKQLQKIYLSLKTYDLRLDIKNPHRLIRAIEQAQDGEVVAKKKPNFVALQIAIDLPREVLYQRIDERVESRFKDGMLEEVQNLIRSGVDSKWLLFLGLEYRIIGQFVLDSNNLTTEQYNNEFERMKQELKYKIHAYARRQLTWFRRFPEIIWCKDLKSAEKEIKKFLL